MLLSHVVWPNNSVTLMCLKRAWLYCFTSHVMIYSSRSGRSTLQSWVHMRREIVAILAKIIARWNEKFQHIYPKACCGQKVFGRKCFWIFLTFSLLLLFNTYFNQTGCRGKKVSLFSLFLMLCVYFFQKFSIYLLFCWPH